MYVCVCHGITESQVEKAIDEGVSNLAGLCAELGVATGCGGCAPLVTSLLENRRSTSVRTPTSFDASPLTLPAPALA